MPVEWRTFPPGDKYLDFDWLDENIPKAYDGDSSHGWCERHPNTTFRYNPTVPAGNTLNILTGLVNNLQNRWEFNVVKVDEWIEISPSHPLYQTIVRQKQDLIRQIKEGLAHVDRAISDVELLAHDARRYKEILGYFARKDEHSLKAMFIDQVDARLPEGISMLSLVRRWPTLIADFQFLNDEDDTVDKILKRIDVSRAEAVVLATKVRLYKRWKELFGKEVKERYRRILERLEGRKASIEEYRNWVRPLIRRVYMMREVDDHTLAMHMNLPIGAGMPVSLQYVEFWAWTKMEGLEAIEPHKPPRIRYEAKGTGPKYYGTTQLKVREKSIPRFRIEPYDDVVKFFIPYIERKHGVKITKEDIMEARKRLYEQGSPSTEWYVLVHIPVSIMVYKLPSGLEIEDVDFNRLSSIFLTQNMMLVKILEIIAEEKKLDLYIDELLGKRFLVGGRVKGIDDFLREQFPELYKKEEEEFGSFPEVKSSIKSFLRSLSKALSDVFGFKLGLVKGPYDPHVHDRLFYSYGRPYLREIFDAKIWAYLQENFGGI